MKILAFRITNFRSIVDSGWVHFSPDGVTVLVGQNESGKTSVLEALQCALSRTAITPDDRRVNATDPLIYLRAEVDFEKLKLHLDEYEEIDIASVKRFLGLTANVVELECLWAAKAGSSALTEFSAALLDPKQFDLFMDDARVPDSSAKGTKVETIADVTTPPTLVTSTKLAIDSSDIGDLIHNALPGGTLFNAESGLLPNTVDLDTRGLPMGKGATAARNFLAIAEIDLPNLIAGDGRYRQNILNRANQRVSDDFTSFWSQLIGAHAKLDIQCAYEHYDSSIPEKAGKAYLEFWISDGNTQLYPKQRSLGVRWFISFYLQLRATQKTKENRVFLLDEPGANLHAKAQGDVLKLLDRLKGEIPIVYSTHSPQMIEYERLFRVRAVQRNGELEDSPTVVIDAHHLGAASSDTLSPILAAMGSDMASQVVVKKTRNVLLEEMSGFYYLKAFWQLADRKDIVHFMAATGVNKLPLLSNMFLGWGLDFVVAVDDDKQGREVFNQLKKELFGDDEALAKARLLKWPGCTAIEEAFSTADFKRLVLNDETAKIGAGNAEYLKSSHTSKPMVAFQFWLAVEGGRISRRNFEPESLMHIDEITEALAALLKARPA